MSDGRSTRISILQDVGIAEKEVDMMGAMHE